jgi:glycosyltransferase involved in cell wall biosynthesis
VVWEGDFEGLHSLAMVNRALCSALMDRGVDMGLVTGSEAQPIVAAERVPLDPRLAARLGCEPVGGPAQVNVRHRFPPDLRPPASGQWVLIQPWEYGSLPKAWMPMLPNVDEIWAYSRSVRDCYLEAGVPPERVHVIPLGVDPQVFQPGLQPMPFFNTF